MRVNFIILLVFFYVNISGIQGFAQKVDRYKLPINESIGVKIDNGSQLTFHITAQNFNQDILLNQGAEIKIYSNQDWVFSWSTNGIKYFQSADGDQDLPVGIISVSLNNENFVPLKPIAQQVASGIKTMPVGASKTSDKFYVCHNPDKNQKVLLIKENQINGHLKHGDIRGKCDDYPNGDGDKQVYQFSDWVTDAFNNDPYPCTTMFFSYKMNLNGYIPRIGSYQTEIVYTISRK